MWADAPSDLLLSPPPMYSLILLYQTILGINIQCSEKHRSACKSNPVKGIIALLKATADIFAMKACHAMPCRTVPPGQELRFCVN